MLDQLDRDLSLAVSAITDSDDVCSVVDRNEYWGWVEKSYGLLFVLLYEKWWDAALEYVRSWTYAEINPREMIGGITSSSLWTAQENLDNAIAVVTDYVNQHG
ncbi:MAG: hypothetical protein Q4A82_02775 [Corynebacterium sp.]|nr:hypothetical protein [Corynebacterium sp.]